MEQVSGSWLDKQFSCACYHKHVLGGDRRSQEHQRCTPIQTYLVGSRVGRFFGEGRCVEGSIVRPQAVKHQMAGRIGGGGGEWGAEATGGCG